MTGQIELFNSPDKEYRWSDKEIQEYEAGLKARRKLIGMQVIKAREIENYMASKGWRRDKPNSSFVKDHMQASFHGEYLCFSFNVCFVPVKTVHKVKIL